MKHFSRLMLCALLSGCTMMPEGRTYAEYLNSLRLPVETSAEFPHCQNYDCETYKLVALSDRDWRRIDRIFKPVSKNAAEEHRRIADAIGMFETIVGPLTGTQSDIKGTFRKTGEGQLDCVDESTNTTIYLSLLRQRGHLQFHDILQPAMRTPFNGGGGRWIHQTAVIQEIKNRQRYVVDSWFHDNGANAEIVPFEDWANGWRPADWHES